MRAFLRTCTCTCTCTLTWTIAVLAQQLPAKLTVEDAVRVAQIHNPAIRQVQNDVDVAHAGVRQGYGAFLPSLSADIGFRGYSSSTVTGQDDYGRPVELPQAIDYKGSSATQGIGLSMTLFDGGSVFAELSAARAQVDAANARAHAETSRLVGEVTRQYYRALRAQRLITVEQQLLASAQERLQRTEQLLRVAGSSPVDVLGARADVASQEQQLARAEAEARKELLTLQQVMGVADGGAFELASDFPAVIDPSSLAAEQMVADALARYPEIVQAAANARAAEKRATSARSNRWPTINASAGFGRSMSLSSYDALFEFNPQNRGFNFGLGASIPLFNGFRTSMQIAQADAAEADAREDVREAKLRVERQVRSALIDVANSHKLLQLAERKAELSRERLELAQEQYRNGAMSFADLQNVIDRTAAAEREVVDARFNYANALSLMKEYSGTL